MLKFKASSPALPAQDIKRARQFYEDKFGLEPTDEQPDGGAVYVTGETGFLVFQSSGKPSGEHTQMILEVDDILATVKELQGRGVKIEEYDYPEFKTEGGVIDLGNEKSAWFKDTEGNLISLAQKVPAVAPRT